MRPERHWLPLVPSYKKRLEPERNGLNQNEKAGAAAAVSAFLPWETVGGFLGENGPWRRILHRGEYPEEENTPRGKIEKRAFSKEERI